jgi:hypothetical protein
MVMKVGHIDCTQDMYEVLKSHTAGPLNETIKEVIEYGALQLIREGNGSLSFRMQCFLPCPSECLSQET